jgi:hypothetical protein
LSNLEKTTKCRTSTCRHDKMSMRQVVNVETQVCRILKCRTFLTILALFNPILTAPTGVSYPPTV